MPCPGYSKGYAISIHAPTGGATAAGNYVLGFALFQSTLPQGERRYHEIVYKRRMGFQSTLPQGERHHLLTHKSVVGLFQSTLPQGERLRLCRKIPRPIHFNPRSHRGSDCKSAQKLSVFYTLLLLSLHNLMNNYNTFSDNI